MGSKIRMVARTRIMTAMVSMISTTMSMKAEDLDSFEDEDGCHEPDNDKDGVLDADDKCPTQAGTEYGCPPKAE